MTAVAVVRSEVESTANGLTPNMAAPQAGRRLHAPHLFPPSNFGTLIISRARTAFAIPIFTHQMSAFSGVVDSVLVQHSTSRRAFSQRPWGYLALSTRPRVGEKSEGGSEPTELTLEPHHYAMLCLTNDLACGPRTS